MSPLATAASLLEPWAINVFRHLFAFREWFVVHLLFVYVFVVSGVVINLTQLLSYVVVRPFSLPCYRRVNVYLAWLHWSQLTFLTEWWSGSDCRLVVEEGRVEDVVANLGRESAIVVMNHKYDIDWLMFWVIAERHGVLGSCKVYAKDSLKYVPLVGPAGWFTESIFLKRNLVADKKTMEASHAALRSYPLPFWMMLFCEGTRFTPAKHRSSMEVARQKGLPELKHHLLPRAKGFCMALNGFRDKIEYVYDFTVCCDGTAAAPTLKNLLYGRRCVAEMLVRRIPVFQVPAESEEATGKWLQQLYREKDAFFQEFVEKGTFLTEDDGGIVGDEARDEIVDGGDATDDGEDAEEDPNASSSPSPTTKSTRLRRRHRRLIEVPMRRRLQPLLNIVFWIVLTVPPLVSFLVGVFVDGNPFAICGVLLCTLLLYVGRRLLLGVTQIEKGSSFGLKKPQ